MNMHVTTPVDRALAAPPVRDKHPSTRLSQRLARWRRHGGEIAYLSLKACGFLGTCWLMAFGLPLLFFLAISGGNLDVLFWQVNNLASRWIAADAARKLAFSQTIQIVLISSTTLIAMWRLPAFLAGVTGNTAHRDDAQ
ncbi:MAG: hypothetical protein H6921_14360 [Sphingomonas sp.]|nr:hypothetical protein [Sphingomonas sp.]HPG05048.1 hypothetical protein [Rhodoblastus sp.]